MIKRNDMILIGIIIIIAIAAIVLTNLLKTDGGNVVITVNGKEYKTLDLNTDTTLTIENEHGEKNVIQIKDGTVKMLEANCPDKLCEQHREIHYNHESIVCLPHKVVAEITKGEENDVDMIAR